jgi:hypothetical protein
MTVLADRISGVLFSCAGHAGSRPSVGKSCQAHHNTAIYKSHERAGKAAVGERWQARCNILNKEWTTSSKAARPPTTGSCANRLLQR